MTPLELLMRSEAAVQLAGLACLFGWVTGFVLAVIIFWRPITHRDGGELRLLRMAVDDAKAYAVILQHRGDELARVASAKQATIDDLSAQVTQLHKDCDRMARAYVERAGTWAVPSSITAGARGAA